MDVRRRIALLVGQPEETVQNLIIEGLLKQAFSDNFDVCVFAMYQKYQITKVRERGESDIFSLVEPDLFDAIIVLTNTIQAQSTMEQIEKRLYGLDKKPVVFVGKKSNHFHTVSTECISFIKEQNPLDQDKTNALRKFGRYLISCAASYLDEKEPVGFSDIPDVTDDSTKQRPETFRRRGGSNFDFNGLSMDDEMLMQTEPEDFIKSILNHVGQISPFDSFHMCLNTDWLDADRLTENGERKKYSAKMLHAMECDMQGNGQKHIDLTSEFDRKELLPGLSVEKPKPSVYFFTPLFFETHCFGYAVINYGQEARCYDAAYKRWLSCVIRGLEFSLRIHTLNAEKTALESAKINESLKKLYKHRVLPKKIKVAAGQRRDQNAASKAQQDKLNLVAELLDNNLFTYFFQPIVHAGTGEIFAYEALMRSTTKEPLSPFDILTGAEALGRLDDVEKATFTNVLNYIKTHKELFTDKKVFINSIPGHMIPSDASNDVRREIKNLPEKIVVEFTEQTELSDTALTDMKKRLEELGAETAIDDYGTGYSNVYNLLRYMPNYVKIDRMLLKDIHLSAQKQHFVKEITEFAHNNQVMVLAEGVEKPEELEMVISLGADLIQGFYTAKPNAVVIPKIDDAIRNEMVQYTQSALSRTKRSVYRAGEDKSVSLIKLTSEHFTKIEFAKDAPYQEVSITGLQNFQANMEIEFEDGYEGQVELTDVYLAVRNEQPTIKLGENCNVTLVLNGENILEQGGVLVPESSELTLRGDGDLHINQIALNGYGIGNDKDGRHGCLNFEQDGLIDIKGNAVKAVGIGAGYGGKINIMRGRYAINFVGIEAVGIGSLFSDVDLAIQNCALDFCLKTAVSVGIGSLNGNVSLNLEHIGLNAILNTNRCVCLGTLEGKSLRINIFQVAMDFDARSDKMSVIGSLLGDVDLVLNKFSLKMSAEGAEAIALGNLNQTARILVQNGDLIVNVINELGFDIGAETFDIIKGFNEFTLNNEKIIREIKEEL